MTTIHTLADLDRELDRANITLTIDGNRIAATPPDTATPEIRTWVAANRQLVLDWLNFTCLTCHGEAAVFDSDGTPWCETHMPATDPAISAALVTLAALGPLTLEQAAS